MSARRAHITQSVTVPFGHLILRLVRLDCGSRGWSLRPEGFEGGPPVVNGSLDGPSFDAFVADLETAVASLRQFRDATEVAVQDREGLP
ncbi:hypothetical protein SAMN04488105_1028 [Salipiger thiooxidans]|uniref:Uncharacterized protein n=1 Tax=Salipiger thiooxidans TaxID=282683 RepID=A0A1G7B7X2_9RHOB|nr:hypothetical protein [Salipiger thiooxidans]SDE23141.1 hypothetical protein SAMN04488105_1028 [Salipiger thiooxidans]